MEIGETSIVRNKVERDAIHIAILQVWAPFRVIPGERLGVTRDGDKWVATRLNPIGVVDPFIEFPPNNGGHYFNLFIFPGTVTDMVHHWTLPCLLDKAAAEARFHKHAENLEVSYEELMEACFDANHYDSYVVQKDSEDQRCYMETIDIGQFWLDYATLSGEKVSDDKHMVYSCSC